MQPMVAVIALMAGLALLTAPRAEAGPPTPGGVSVVPVDSLERIFPDREPQSADPGSIHVPRGGSAAFQFAIRSHADMAVELQVTDIATADGIALDATIAIYEVLPVHVEANTNGGSKTAVGRVPPDDWMREFIRKAPFDVAEVLVPSDRMKLRAGQTHGALVDISVADDAAPGRYEGRFRVVGGDAEAEAQFSLMIHKTAMPDQYALHSVHWLQPEPENLTLTDRPEWWGEGHWQMLEHSGRVMRRFGQDTILTPLIDYEHPLIQTYREADGGYTFDFTRFDRWVRMFDRLGYRLFAGHHIDMLPEKWVYDGVFVIDRETGEKSRLVERGKDNEAWLDFIPIFYDALYRHLQESGWLDRYIQHQLDEPKDEDLYRRLVDLIREHMPGVRTIDAINHSPEHYSPLVDIQVFAVALLPQRQELVAQRQSDGLSSWLYNCCSPYPPYPNRHLDERLCNSQLYPWLAFKLNAEGYLNWGGNVLRGADPYVTSVGPVPGGSQNPGHPPGDNWFFYPGPEGLCGSMRMLAFRDGLMDHALLSMLAERDPQQAEQIVAEIVRDLSDYAKDTGAYHSARERLLNAVDGR